MRLRIVRKPHVCDAKVLRTSRGAVLIEQCDGRVRCWCAFLCDATSEECEFAEERKALAR